MARAMLIARRLVPSFALTALALHGAACSDPPRDDDDDNGSTGSGVGGMSVQSSVGSGMPASCSQACYSHQNSMGCGALGLTWDVAAGTTECELEWLDCTNGNRYGVSCTGSEGAWSCECALNGPAAGTFNSPTFCDWNTEASAREEANTACSWAIEVVPGPGQ
jgi:hypothetical protein